MKEQDLGEKTESIRNPYCWVLSADLKSQVTIHILSASEEWKFNPNPNVSSVDQVAGYATLVWPYHPYTV